MAPGKLPGNSGTRNLHDNLSDLRAQVAANRKVYVGRYTCNYAIGIKFLSIINCRVLI